MTKDRVTFQKRIPIVKTWKKILPDPGSSSGYCSWPTPTDKPISRFNTALPEHTERLKPFPAAGAVSDGKAQVTGCHTARRARGTPLATRHISGTQWQSYRDPISRPCLTARPAPSPGPTEDSAFGAPGAVAGAASPQTLRERPETARLHLARPLHGPPATIPVGPLPP